MTNHDILHLVAFILIAIGIPFIGAVLINYVANRFKNLK